ncbi:MAG: L,D-transpeptidase family protein [Burkholderiaceae bacterium]|nr:L,D-transpeptidase family protein [Burkholderiaceae bacterium]
MNRTRLTRAALAAALALALALTANAATTKKKRKKGASAAQTSQAAPSGKASARAAAKAAAGKSASRRPVPPQAVRDGEAEARLIEIYKLIGQARGREALSQAEGLVRDHPDFQLAQLVRGDLLSARTRPVRAIGDVPDTTAKAASGMLADLREESQLRLKALRERPPAGAVPSQFLALSSRSRHAIAVDTSRARLYLFENTTNGLKLVADYYISVGKSGVQKATEGDLRTPLGVYYITSSLDPRSLKDFYGAGALPINYPNPYDARQGKTGSGIWLHGTPPGQFARPPKSTDGCVVMANPDLERILGTVQVGTTPVVIAQSLRWVPPHSVRADSKTFEDTLQAWRNARISGDVSRALNFYASDFSTRGKSLAEWTPQLRTELDRLRGREITLKDVSMLRWTDQSDTMVVTFGEVADGLRAGTTRRQYWMRQGTQWKIFYEGVIG